MMPLQFKSVVDSFRLNVYFEESENLLLKVTGEMLPIQINSNLASKSNKKYWFLFDKNI